MAPSGVRRAMQKKRREGTDMNRRRQVDRDRKRARRTDASGDLPLSGNDGQRSEDVSEGPPASSYSLPSGVAEETKKAIYDKCKRALSNDEMSERTCCVCDRLYRRVAIVTKALARGEKFQSAMKRRLRPPSDLPAYLEKTYSAVHLHPSLDGMMLSCEGIFTCARGKIWLQICKSCHGSLSNSRTELPPKFAIANGLFFGVLPVEFDDTTPTENAMLNLGQPTHFISAVRGGAHSSLRSHAYVFRSRPQSPATMVPTDVLELGSFKVRMVGALTSGQKIRTMRRYQVRSERLRSQLEWYQENNPLYQDESIEVNEDLLKRPTCVVVDQTTDNAVAAHCASDAAHCASQLDESVRRFNAPEPAHILTVAEEEGELEEQATVSVVTDFPRPTETEDIRHVLRDPDVIVHRSSDILSDYNPAFWTLAFCELYPFGRGGLEEPRQVPIGLHEYLKHCLSVSSRRFVKHYSFLLVAFDVLARHRAMNAIQLTTRLSPDISGGVASLQRRDLEAHLREKERLIGVQSPNANEPNAPPSNNCRALESGLNAGLRAYWGSSQEKASTRMELFSLAATFGQPSVFFTFSPSSSSAIRIANLVGKVPDDLVEIYDANIGQDFHQTRSQLGKLASQCPMVCARYFDRLMNIIIDKVIGWDANAGVAHPQGGIFGKTVAFHAVTESQNSTGDLHAHMLVWVEGLPSSIDEYYDCWANEEYRNAALAYANSIVANKIPHMTTVCPKCQQQTLKGVPLTQEAYKKVCNPARSFPTSECTSCKCQYGGDELLQEQIRHRAKEMNIDPALLTEDAIRCQVASPIPLDMPSQADNAASLVFAQALLTYQHHHWRHCKSCFKPSCRIPKGDTCRMFFPKERHEHTSVSDDGRVVIERPIGHEYVVSYSLLFAAIFKLNHDIKLLGAGEGLEKAHYMMKYSTKDQEQIEHRALIYLNAYDKAAQKFADPNDPTRTGTKRIMSMMSSITSAQEVTAPQAGLFIERGSLDYSSHRYAKLHMKTFMQAIERQPCSLVLRQGDNADVFEASSDYHDYILRPQELDDTNLAQFVSLWQKKRGTAGLRLPETHKHYRTHSIYQRQEPTCVTPTGGRLPNANADDLPQDKRLYYVKFLLLMFKPFRSRADLVAPDTDWESAFSTWWETRHANDAKAYSKYALDYYHARLHTRKQPDRDIEHFNSLSAGDGQQSETLDWDESDSEDGENIDIDFQEDSTDPTLEEPTWGYAPLVRNYSEAMDIAAASAGAHEDLQLTVTASQLKQEIAQISSDQQPRALQDAREAGAVATRVSVLAGLDLNPPWRPRTNSQQQENTSIPDYSQLDVVSQHHNLNERQHEMFVLAGSALLRDFQSEEGCRRPRQDSDQFRGFLAGLPGAGKSLVIKALQDLAASWKRPAAVKTMAFQGVAAQAANGETIHKCFGWRLNGIDDNWRPNTAQEEAFAAVKLIIIDEISTTDAKFIGQIDICLRKIRRTDTILGAIHTLFVGDWLQQLPIAGKPAFEQYVSTREQENCASLHHLRGATVYQQMRTVVILTENMRHRNDPTWGEILDRWRFGSYDQEDLNLVNSTCHRREWNLPPDETNDSFCPIVVCSNQLRYEFNQEAFRRHCTTAKTAWFRFPAELSRTRGSISEAQRNSLSQIRDDKTGNLPIVLDVCIGMPVQCTKNISKELRLANGTIGHVVGIIPTRTSTVTLLRDSVSGHPIHSHSKLPETILVKLRGYAEHHFLPSLPVGVVPIFPHTQRSVCIPLPNRKFSVNIVQMPLIPAFSITADKSQGLTVNQMILGPLKHSTRTRPQRAAHYVATTRVRSMSRLLIMEPLQMTTLEYFRPSQAVVQEVLRLQELSSSQKNNQPPRVSGTQ